MASRIWEVAGLPKHHLEAFGSFRDLVIPDSQYQDLILAFAGLKPGNMLLVIGNPGIGKTQLAVLAARRWLEAKKSVRYWPFRQLASSAIACMYEEEPERRRGVQDRLTARDLIIIDDIQSVRSRHDRELLSDLIDLRYTNEKSLILLSNEPSTERIFTPSAFDRIQEAGAVFRCSWPSFRTRHD